jgi:hypothetical protein
MVAQHPELYFRVCMQTAIHRATVSKMDREKSYVFNQLAERNRTKDVSSGTRGPTKFAIDQAVRASADYEEVCNDLIDAQEALLKWEALEKAWASRGFTLRDVVRLYIARSAPTYMKEETPPHKSLATYKEEKSERKKFL